MNIKGKRLARLVQDVYATQMDEIQCQEAAVQIVNTANALLSDEESRQRYPALWQHFRFCPDCKGEYDMVLDLARLEASGQLQMPRYVPALPDATRFSLWELAQNAITALFPGFQPAVVPALTRAIGLSSVEPVEVLLAGGLLSILLTVAPHEQDVSLRDLLLMVSSADFDFQEKVEGSSVWLQIGETGPAIQEQTINESGGITFVGIPPDHYTLQLQIAGQEYIILSLVVP